MQTHAQIITELNKLAPKQRTALRRRFPGGQNIRQLECIEFLGKIDVVKVVFEGGLMYRVWIGPRGAIKSCECLGRVAL